MSRLAMVVMFAFAAALPAAQGERIAIRRAVAPNQTLHVRITSEWDYDQQIKKIHTDARVGYTLVTDAHSEGERYNARVTFDEATVSVTADGQPISQQQPFAIVVGKPMTAIYDGQGRFQDVDVPFELSAGNLAVTRFFMNGAFTADALLQRWPPSFDLAVGGSIEIPSEVALPIPGTDPAAPGGRRLKLVSIEQSGRDRIAKMEQTFEGELSGAMTGQGVSLSASGAGTVEWNVDRAFASAYDITFRLDANRPAVATLRHTVHTRMTVTN